MYYSLASLKTDKFVRPERLDTVLGGPVTRLCDYVKEYQIYDRELWNRFVNLFRCPADACDWGWRCEFWGKMMRGAASVYAYTHDEELYAILKESTEALLKTAKPDGSIVTFLPDCDLVGWDVWGRKYVLLGIQYFCEVCHEPDFVEKCEAAMCRHLDALMAKVGRAEGKKKITETSNNWLGANACSILEPVVRLYNKTKKKEYLDFAAEIVDACYGGEGELKIFQEALDDKLDPYQYCEPKAYETMSCFEGLIEYYRTVGGENHLTACKNFARRVLDSEVSIIGCCGCKHEEFDNTRLHQVDPTVNGTMQETCVSVTWMKFCGQMLRLTGDVRYADAIEQTFFNAYLGAANFPQKKVYFSSWVEQVKGSQNDFYGVLPFDSYSPLRKGARGQYIGGFQMLPDTSFYGCCACISPMGIGTYTETSALLSENGIVINSYLQGTTTLDCPSGKVTYKTVSGYPYDGNVEIELDAEGEFTVTLRIPEWSRVTSVFINGENIEVKKGYLDIKKEWHKGDTITLNLDDNTYAVFPPEDSQYKNDYIAVKKGAVVMALDSRIEMPDRKINLDIDEQGRLKTRAVPCGKLPYFNLSMMIKECDGRELHFIDYASAGTTFDKESTMAAWIER